MSLQVIHISSIVPRFKLHLRSRVGAGRSVGDESCPLPLNKTVVEVFGDFLRYLLECASSYIQDTHANGYDLWNSVGSHIDFVLSHPNGWEGTQQSEMRRAAVLAGLVPDNESGHSCLSFVTEGEASLHFCVQNGFPAGAMKVLIQLSSNFKCILMLLERRWRGDRRCRRWDYQYKLIQQKPEGGLWRNCCSSMFVSLHYSEKWSTSAHYMPGDYRGSVFVTSHASRFLESMLLPSYMIRLVNSLPRSLKHSSYLDNLEDIVRCFDKTTKHRFRNPEEPEYVKFGSTKDNDKSCNIRMGQLKLMG